MFSQSLNVISFTEYYRLFCDAVEIGLYEIDVKNK